MLKMNPQQTQTKHLKQPWIKKVLVYIGQTPNPLNKINK